MTKFCVFDEERTSTCFGKYSCRNWVLCVTLGSIQLIFVVMACVQHIYSIVRFDKVLFCQFNLTKSYDSFEGLMSSSDIIIFDFGLFYKLLGTVECVANYLDGGYGRAMWCTVHLLGLTALLLMIVFDDQLQCQYRMMWPALLMQSIFSLGLIIFTMATSPKILKAIFSISSFEMICLLSIFAGGCVMNHLLTISLWHYYWSVERKAIDNKITPVYL